LPGLKPRKYRTRYAGLKPRSSTGKTEAGSAIEVQKRDFPAGAKAPKFRTLDAGLKPRSSTGKTEAGSAVEVQKRGFPAGAKAQRKGRA